METLVISTLHLFPNGKKNQNADIIWHIEIVLRLEFEYPIKLLILANYL